LGWIGMWWWWWFGVEGNINFPHENRLVWV